MEQSPQAAGVQPRDDLRRASCHSTSDRGVVGVAPVIDRHELPRRHRVEHGLLHGAALVEQLLAQGCAFDEDIFGRNGTIGVLEQRPHGPIQLDDIHEPIRNRLALAVRYQRQALAPPFKCTDEAARHVEIQWQHGRESPEEGGRGADGRADGQAAGGLDEGGDLAEGVRSGRAGQEARAPVAQLHGRALAGRAEGLLRGPLIHTCAELQVEPRRGLSGQEPGLMSAMHLVGRRPKGLPDDAHPVHFVAVAELRAARVGARAHAGPAQARHRGGHEPGFATGPVHDFGAERAVGLDTRSGVQ
mmetsp:Transcript_70190/g.203508  ORF Transcript_70190/g.203508 Transcript_70190/m.203508 type:complete len:302 (-) Transcript_70190:426-1331(-)